MVSKILLRILSFKGAKDIPFYFYHAGTFRAFYRTFKILGVKSGETGLYTPFGWTVKYEQALCDVYDLTIEPNISLGMNCQLLQLYQSGSSLEKHLLFAG
jgi:hypothetical protein